MLATFDSTSAQVLPPNTTAAPSPTNTPSRQPAARPNIIFRIFFIAYFYSSSSISFIWSIISSFFRCHLK